MTEVKKQPRSRVYDQFIFADQMGLVNSSMAVLILRNLLNNGGMVGEGVRAAKIGSRTFRPEWTPLIEKLHAMGYVSFKPTGHGTSRTVSLTDNAKEFLTEKQIEVEVEPTEVTNGNTVNA
jgi:hypothetical protein